MKEQDALASTAPKPFVFVLMPFDKGFDDIYKFGIKGAAQDAGAYAERLDEQLFTEGMLDRIFSQIDKADVIVADMTGRNANVFYEVGYAHALGKTVLLVTQNAADIPFDLKHRQHTVYGGKIESLRNELTGKISWAIQESKKARAANAVSIFIASLYGYTLTESRANVPAAKIRVVIKRRDFALPLLISNASGEMTPAVSHIYLATGSAPTIRPIQYVRETLPASPTTNWSMLTFASTNTVPQELKAMSSSRDGQTDHLQYRLGDSLPSLPPGAVEERALQFQLSAKATMGSELYRLRLHSSAGAFEFAFELSARLADQPPAAQTATKADAMPGGLKPRKKSTKRGTGD